MQLNEETKANYINKCYVVDVMALNMLRLSVLSFSNSGLSKGLSFAVLNLGFYLKV